MQRLADLTPEARLDLGDKLRAMSDADKMQFLDTLTPAQQSELLYDPLIWLRPKQFVPPDPDKNIALVMSGRGFGKTHMLTRMLKYYIHELGVRDFVLAGASNHDVVQTLVAGSSGILRSYADNDPEKPTYSPHHGVLRYPCGAVGRTVSSESPERARGINSELLLADELGSWAGDALDFFHNLEYGLRLGASQALLATTPRSTKLMIDLVNRGKDPNGNVRIITGSTLENEQHLTPQMIAKAKATMDTRLGKQEVQGILILTNDKACWNPDLLDACKATCSGEFHPSEWVEIAIGVDPSAGNTKKSSDKTGIVVAVKTQSNKVLVVEDRSDRMSGEKCVSTISELYEKYSQFAPTKVHVEKNGVGAMYKTMILRDHPFMPIHEFPSTTQKYARAMAAAHLYETGLVFHDSNAKLGELESEMCEWEGTNKSPDHVDALTFAVSALTSAGGFTKRKKFIL